jgi:hypothetical protein
MRRLIVAVVAAAFVVGPVPVHSMPPEGCEAVNPGVPVCKFKVTHKTNGPVSGVAGVGDWVVIVKKGRKKVRLSSPAAYGEPATVEYLFKKGSKVKAKALSPGSALVVGGE